MGMSAMGHKRTLTKAHSRSQKRLIGRLLNTTERNCTYDRDGDCPMHAKTKALMTSPLCVCAMARSGYPVRGFTAPVQSPKVRRRCPTKRGTMLKSIPWDVWVAAAIAAAIALAAFFQLGLTIFIIIYLGLCAYVAVQTFGSGRDIG
jgi:hypothetical protein